MGMGNSPSYDEMRMYKSICSGGCNYLYFSGTDCSTGKASLLTLKDMCQKYASYFENPHSQGVLPVA